MTASASNRRWREGLKFQVQIAEDVEAHEVVSSAGPHRYPPNQFAFLLDADGHGQKPPDDFGIRGRVQRGFGGSERATSCQRHREQQLVGQMFIHRHVRLEPCLGGFDCRFGHFLCGPATLAKSR